MLRRRGRQAIGDGLLGVLGGVVDVRACQPRGEHLERLIGRDGAVLDASKKLLLVLVERVQRALLGLLRRTLGLRGSGLSEPRLRTSEADVRRRRCRDGGRLCIGQIGAPLGLVSLSLGKAGFRACERRGARGLRIGKSRLRCRQGRVGVAERDIRRLLRGWVDGQQLLGFSRRTLGLGLVVARLFGEQILLLRAGVAAFPEACDGGCSTGLCALKDVARTLPVVLALSSRARAAASWLAPLRLVTSLAAVWATSNACRAVSYSVFAWLY